MASTNTLPQVLRWTARGIGALILAFVALNLIGNGSEIVENFAPENSMLWLGFALSLAGFALLWKWELIGGVIALCGIVLFYAVHYATDGSFTGGWAFPLFFVPGCLSIICWLMGRKRIALRKM